MITDLHSHTFYSNCGRDDPEALILRMIEQGVQVLGITDHNYGIGGRGEEYRKTIRSLAAKYSSKIKVLCGIEICTLPRLLPDKNNDFAEYDYCLVENLSYDDSEMKRDILSYTSGYKCPVGIAHTDIFGFIEDCGLDADKYLKSLADRGIFWELNVNYDSIHGYREHEYVKTFFNSEAERQAVKRAGLYVSVGFDGHRMEDYDVKRVKDANDFLETHGIKNAVDLITGFNKNKK